MVSLTTRFTTYYMTAHVTSKRDAQPVDTESGTMSPRSTTFTISRAHANSLSSYRLQGQLFCPHNGQELPSNRDDCADHPRPSITRPRVWVKKPPVIPPACPLLHTNTHHLRLPHVPTTPPLGGSHHLLHPFPIDSEIREMGYIHLSLQIRRCAVTGLVRCAAPE